MQPLYSFDYDLLQLVMGQHVIALCVQMAMALVN